MRLFIICSAIVAFSLLVLGFSLAVQPVDLSAPVILLMITGFTLRYLYRLLSVTQRDRRHRQRIKHAKRHF